MNRFFLLGIIAVVIGVILAVPLLSDQFADARIVRKIQFTQSVTSSQDPGLGHGNEQLAIILQPSNGTLYHGSLTYTANEPLQIIILHQIDKSESKGQPIWTVDNNTLYAETIINSNSNGGTLDFTGAAVALHSTNSSQFAATVSVDGWIRGTTPEFIQKAQIISENTLRLARAEMPVKIPFHEGLYNGKPVYFIITDSSNNADATQLSDKQNWKIQTSPLLAQAPQKMLTKMYVFTNGVSGNGTKGYQYEVFSDTPSDKDYTPVSNIVQVTWNLGRTPQILNSTKDIMDANMTGKLYLTTTNTIVNTPQIVWPDGKLQVREDKTLTDQNAYTGGQILDIDNATKIVTFVAHRGWNFDGKTVYYIVITGTPQGPTELMGVAYTPALTVLSSSARDLYHFTNGVKGAGPFGFQEGITDAQPGDTSYSPICKVSTITWKDPQSATVLENLNDTDYEKSKGDVAIQSTAVFGSSYIIECPIIDISKNNS